MAVPNFLNGGAFTGLSSVHDLMLGVAGKALGRQDLLQRYGQRQSLPYSRSFFTSLGSQFGDVLGAVSGNRLTTASAERLGALKDLVQKVSPDEAEALYSFHTDSATPLGKGQTKAPPTAFDKANHFNLIANLAQDNLWRSTILQVELQHLASKHAPVLKKILEAKPELNIYEAMNEYQKVSKPFREELSQELKFATTEAMRNTGGRVPTKGSISAGIVDVWSKIPFAWTLQPFMNFALGNALPSVMEHMPVLPLMELMPKGIRERNRGYRSTHIDKLRMDTKAYEKAFQEGLKDTTLRGADAEAVLIAKKRAGEGERQIKLWEKEGLSRPEKVYAQQATGAMLIALFAAIRASRGEDGMDYDQAPQVATGQKADPENQRIHLTSALGPLAPFALMGDYVGRKAIGSDYYSQPEGQLRWKEMASALGSRGTGTTILDVLGSGEAEGDGLTKSMNRMAQDLQRGMTSGAWYGEGARGLAGYTNPENNISRRLDTEPFAGVMTNIPGLRTTLPPAIDKTSGEPRLEGRSVYGREPNQAMRPGPIQDMNPIARFMQENRGWIKGGDVFFKNTDDPAYDQLVADFSKQQFQEDVIPWLQEPGTKQLSREERTVIFTEKMQNIREAAHAEAVDAYLQAGKDLPPGIQKGLEKSFRRSHILEEADVEGPDAAEKLSPEETLELQGKDLEKILEGLR